MHRPILSGASVALAAMLLAAPSATAQPMPSPDQRVFAFGGAFVSGNMDDALNPISAEYEGNRVLGVGYQYYFGALGAGFQLGSELGLALRVGDISSAEAWAGLVLRHDGIVLADAIRVSPSFTFGVSAVTDGIGVERDREAEHAGDSTLLFYLGPEISLSAAENPQLEVFWRLHHRSGAWGTLGGMGDTANANVVGVRWHF